MEFFRQEYWSGLPFPPPGDLPDPGIKPVSPAWQANSLPLSQPGSPTPVWPPLTTTDCGPDGQAVFLIPITEAYRSLALGQLPPPKHSPLRPTAEAERGLKDPWVQKENGQK